MTRRLGFLAVVLFLGLPLMYGLREPDMGSDEAIYSYEVQRVLDTGEWLTPRSIPNDLAFLEKPPLKVWIVAAGIRSGLLPRDERGLRFFDGLFGAIAFLYVFFLGRQLGGETCGVVAGLVLFATAPLIFDHGLRSDNMEAAVLLCYCGGVYHFSRWMASARAPGRRHALAVAGYFVLGFMTKFVAALFLPLVCVVAFAWRRDAWTRARQGWRDWWLPAALVVVVTAPWFIYETRLFGRMFWHVIFGVHVFTRFTGTLDPDHLHVWHYYFSASWSEAGRAGSLLLVLAGMVALARAAWRDEPPIARLLVVWGVLPLAVMSFGTSKLLHYAYPFWPPFALGAGLACASAFRALDGRPGAWLSARLARIPLVAGGPKVRRYLLAGGVAFGLLAGWTAFVGPIEWDWRGITIMRSTSLVRPIAWSATLLFLGVYATTPARLAGGLVLALLLPIRTYAGEVTSFGIVNHPLRATQECVGQVEASGVPAGRGILSASGNILHHSYYYYLWRLGPWVIAPAFSGQDVIDRLATPGGQTPVILNHADYDTLSRTLPGPDAVKFSAVRYDDNIAVLLPGPYARCADPILAAGGRAIWRPRLATAGR